MAESSLIKEVDIHLLELRYGHTRIQNDRASLRMQNSLLPQNSVGFGQLRLLGEQTNHLIGQGWQVYKSPEPRKYTIGVCL